ncbi:MAG: hypothetical protein GY909_18755 [Oligoflexia bacterium]|nr:hypothetical protein [Oligoflexia bacterium]
MGYINSEAAQSSDAGVVKPPRKATCGDSNYGYDTNPPHQQVREGAKSLNNSVSAALLYDMFNHNEAYKNRLKNNYPHLFSPSSQYRDLLSVVREELGDSYKDGGSMFDHRDTMGAMNLAVLNSGEFQGKLEAKLQSIKQKYADGLRKKAKKVCSSSLARLYADFPMAIDQYLIDLPEAGRKIASLSMCSNKKFYDPRKYDSDCDGVKDYRDDAPRDPFSPRTDHNVTSSTYNNPPFGSNTNYSVKLEGETLKLKTPLKIKVNSSIDDASKTRALGNLRRCAGQLVTEMRRSFDQYKDTIPEMRSRNLEVEIEFEEVDDNSSFTIHKCWCSTCNQRYVDAAGNEKRIPRHICFDDLTDEMKAGLANRELNPTDQTGLWRNGQADAANLNHEASGNCTTLGHEFLHKMGLPDEYLAENYYPFNLLDDDHSSFMSSGTTMKRRHIAGILSPKKCEDSVGNRSGI